MHNVNKGVTLNFESYGFHPFKLMISEEPRHFWPLEI